MRKAVLVVSLGLGFLIAASPAAAAPVTVGAGWTSFSWVATEPTGPFEFSSARPVVLQVTDAFCRGDRFELRDGGTVVGTTPSVPVFGCTDPNQVTDPVVAFQDPSYSHGRFVLGAGAHSITIREITGALGGGAGFLRVDTLPLPTSKEQCKTGGWQAFGVFKNQGDCVSFVATGGRNQPAGGGTGP
jgi:hypothetical protein